MQFLQVFRAHFCIAFFSPSGVEFVLPLLKSYCDLQTLKVSSHVYHAAMTTYQGQLNAIFAIALLNTRFVISILVYVL